MELKKGEKVLKEGKASYSGRSGTLYLTDQRLLWEYYETPELFPTKAEKGEIEIPLEDITEVNAFSRVGFRTVDVWVNVKYGQLGKPQELNFSPGFVLWNWNGIADEWALQIRTAAKLTAIELKRGETIIKQGCVRRLGWLGVTFRRDALYLTNQRLLFNSIAGASEKEVEVPLEEIKNVGKAPYLSYMFMSLHSNSVKVEYAHLGKTNTVIFIPNDASEDWIAQIQKMAKLPAK